MPYHTMYPCRKPLKGALAAIMLGGCFSLLSVLPVQAGSLLYKPTNPSFGGNSFNGSYLLSNASAQREAKKTTPKDPIDDFANTLSRSLLSRLSRDIADQIYGEDAADSGNYQIGDTAISFYREDGQVILNINDLLTGASTTISLPDPQETTIE